MHYITLDTNTWIYLANGTEPVRLLHFIKREVEKNNITILLPDIITKEWEIHKEKTVRQGSIKHFNEVKEALERILKLLGDKGERDILSFLLDENDDKDYFKDFLEKFKLKKKEIDEAISDNIKLIDELFKSHSTKINIKDEVYIKSGHFALEKKAPFKLKNSFADSLILFSVLDYVKSNAIEDAIFISYNTDDFCEKKEGKKTLHSDLVEEFKNAKCHFYKIVGEALNTIEKNILSNEELDLIEEMQNDESWNYEPEFCQVCQENNDRLNAVTSWRSYDLKDERISGNVNPTQSKFDFSKNTIQPISKEPITTIEVGHCDWCNSEHFKCINCQTVNAIWDGEHSERKECEGCGLNYVINKAYDSNAVDEEVEYTVPKDTVTCQKCGEEFDEGDILENICFTCEEEYAYGNK